MANKSDPGRNEVLARHLAGQTTKVAPNRFGARQVPVLSIIEQAFTEARAAIMPAGARIEHTVAGLGKLHHELLQDVYENAGQIRSVPADGTIDRMAEQIDRDLKRLTPQRTQSLDDQLFGMSAGNLLAWLDAASFYDPPDMATGLFMNDIGDSCGFPIHWDRIDPEAMLDAQLTLANSQDTRPMRWLMMTATSDQPPPPPPRPDDPGQPARFDLSAFEKPGPGGPKLAL